MILEFLRRLRGLAQRSRIARDVDDEMRLHLEMREERLRAAGMGAGEASAAARRRFGNATRLREDAVDAWGWRWLEHAIQDARFGLRTLLRNPAFAATAILTLALATGATTAIFSIVDSVLLRPLPMAEPERIVHVYGRSWREDRPGTTEPVLGPVTDEEFQAYSRDSTSFEGFAAYAQTTRHLAGASGPERLVAIAADKNLFSVLGATALVGRTFVAGDPAEVVVLSAPLWRHRFGADPALVGRTITMEGRAYTVLGVMPDAFTFPYGGTSFTSGALSESRTDLWFPLERRGRMSAVARMKPGVDIETARSELRVLAARIESTKYAGTRIRVNVRLEPIADVVLGEVRRSLWILFAAVALVLVAACANVANLFLARMTARTREVVTRAALGAGRWRLARQFLAESLLLSLAGGLLGIAVAHWGTRLLVSISAARIPRAHEIALDWRAFAFLLAACVATAALFGLAPAMAAARVDVVSVTKETSGGTATAGRRYRRIRDALVVVEVALAFVLALGAALIVGEVLRLKRTPTGMVTDNVVTFHMTPRTTAADYYAIEQRVAQLGGVTAAGFVQLVPLQNWGWQADFSVEGQPAEGRRIAVLRYVTPGYFRALGIPLVQGRGFTAHDTAQSPRVLVVNEALVRRYLPDGDAVGVALDRGTIVGVIGDVRQAGLDRPTEPEIYYAAAQNVTMASDIGMSLVVRAAGAPEGVIDRVRAAVRDVNPALAIFNIKTMEEVIADSLWELNLYRWLLGLFAALAVLLAAIGLYGVISYSVTARLREFAIRLALGSAPGEVLRLVLGRAVRLAAAGVAIGVVLAAALVPLARNTRITLTNDPLAYVAIAVSLIVLAMLASLVPASLAARVNAATALRHD